MTATPHQPHIANVDKLKLEKIALIQQKLAAADFDLDAFMSLIVEEVQHLTPATGAVIELASGEEMIYRASTGSMAEYIGVRIPIKNSMSGLCFESKQVLRSDDTELDSRVNLGLCRKVQARSMVVTPLLHGDKVIGVLKIVSKEPNAFSEDDVETLQLMARFLGAGLAQQILQEIKSFY